MSEKNIINIEESEDIKQREQKNKRQEEIIKLKALIEELKGNVHL